MSTERPADRPATAVERVQAFDLDGLLATTVGTVTFAVAALLIVATGHAGTGPSGHSWLAVAISGVGLGLIGLVYCGRRRRRRLRRG